MKIKIKLFLIFALLIVLPITFFAALKKPVQIAQGAGPLIITFQSQPLFSSSGMLPGDAVTRFFTVQNDGAEPAQIQIRAVNTSNTPPSPAISDVLYIDIPGQSPQTLTQFYSSGWINLPVTPPGESSQYDLKITFDSDSGNEYQLTQTLFDLEVSVQGNGSSQIPEECKDFIFDGQIILGTPGDDHLIGSLQGDIIVGFGGDDLITARSGNDCVVGGEGDDRLQGNPGDDILIGGPGIDTAHGASGTDTCDAETENLCEI